MTFLNPAILFGLFAISIPILIHLLNLRKIRKVEFSTLMFLKEIQKSKMRRIRLKQLVLLLLRICIIVFLVLSFAKPVYEGYAGDSDASSKATALIFVDDSFSMNARDNQGLYLSQAKESVRKILETHKESDEIYLIPTSKISIRNAKLLYNNFKDILDTVNSLKFSYKTFSITEIFNISNRLLEQSTNSVKEIFIISDFQKNNFITEVSLPGDVLNIKENSVHTYLIDIGSRVVNNLSLDSFKVVSKILEKNRDIKIKIFLNNHNQYNAKNKTVNLYIDGELRGEKVVDVNSYEKREVEFISKINKSGSVNGVIELVQNEFHEDELLEDNKYYFTLNIPEKFNISFIEDNPIDFNFIKLAFNSASNILSDTLNRKSELFNITIQRYVSENIYNSNVVFISNKRSFTESEAIILNDFISKGGGVFLFLGKDIDILNYNNTLFNKFNSLNIAKLNLENENNSNLKFNKVDFEHPILSEVFENPKLNITSDKFNIESPAINSYYQLLLNTNAMPIISLSNNYPFLVESEISKGKIIIAAVSATNDLSDLPLKSLFVPLIIRSVYYLGNNFEYQKNYIVGQTNLISVFGLKDISTITWLNKNKFDLKVDLANDNENFISLPYSNLTSEVGNYILEDSVGNNFSFSLNFNAAESDLSKLTEAELIKFFNDNEIKNIKLIKSNAEVIDTIQASKNGMELWKYFLIMAIIFLASEILFSKRLENS